MKVGDKVYCVDNSGRNSINNLVKGKIYVVTYIYERTKCLEVCDFGGRTYSIDRFVTEKGLRKLKLDKINGKI